jgi:glycosyltransferase involved in cell wall biosynthesis
MKILYCTDQLFLHGGVEKITTHKLNYLSKKSGYEITICTFQQQNKPFVYELNKVINHHDLNVNYNRNKSYFSPFNFFRLFFHFIKFILFCKKIKPDIIISVNNTPEQYFIPFIPFKNFTIKEFHSSHEINKGHSKHFLGFDFFSLILNRYNYKVVLNQDELKYYNFKNVIVIPNFIFLSDISHVNTNKKKTVISVGRIVPIKQFEHIIKAWAIIEDDFPDWKLDIYGDGNEFYVESLRKLISKNNLKSIHIYSSTDNILEKMSEASIFISSSISECFPMVMLESMASKLAIVSYDCPNGPRNIFKDNVNGFLISPNNINSLSQGISKLMGDKVLLEKFQSNSNEIVKSFSAEVIMLKWEYLFKNID